MQHNEDARFIWLLEKWQSGDFSRKDARELEELTRDDAFRKDAWEGFQALPEENHQKTLDALRLRLRQKYDSKPAIGGFRIMLSAAAALLLLLATVWLIRTNQSAKELAQLSSPTNTHDGIAAQHTDATANEKSLPPQPIEQQNTESNFGKQKTLETKQLPRATPAQRAESQGQEPVSVGDISTAQTDAVTVVATESARDDATAVAEDVTKESEQLAKPLEKKTPAAPSSSSAKKKKDTADKTWSENNGPADMDKLRREARKKEMPARTEPGGGWEMFNDYLRQNARLTPQANAANVSGTVRLQFSVNDNGEPQGIIVLRSLGYGLDQEARRLIENWVWIKGIDPFISVDIPFSR